MTSFESLDKLHHKPHQAPLPHFLDPTLCQVSEPDRSPASARALAPRAPGTANAGPDRRGLQSLTQAQRLQAISRVTGGIAHNFNNLLAGIIGFCELIGSKPTSPGQAPNYAAEIASTAHRASDQVQHLLAFSQQLLLHPQKVKINRIVSDLKDNLKRAAGEDIEVEIDLDPWPDVVEADPQQLEQIIRSLATNAIEAMPDGGCLTVRTRSVEVESFSPRHLGIPNGRYTLFEVEDTGKGIDEAIYDRIFEPFFSTKENLNGTGLGLAMVYGLVKQSGGQIRVDSQPGQRTCFSVYLPPADSDPGDISSKQRRRLDRRNRLSENNETRATILLAEDDPTMQLVLKAFLRQRGFAVITASDGAEGIERSRRYEGKVDVLLTDIVMPNVGGLGLAQALRSERKDIKILFMSGYSQDRISLRALIDESPEVDFLKKPFKNDELETRLERLLALNTSVASQSPTPSRV